ncbi:SseB family protein [Streptomyces sp. NPDC059142]|uniref:SseB family protein n=1 Tax=Streptomyces sp. NPDC059142 TaxID=3346739 RepID=UPI0036744669
MTTSRSGPPGRERPLRLADLARSETDRRPAPAPAPPSRPAPPADAVAAARTEFAALLGEFRRTAALVPDDGRGGLWTAEQGGIRWICAFSDEAALARFAFARGEAAREWPYRTVLGARLLDVMVPLLGVPAGVALDAGSPDGMLFPPVAGVVPETAAVDAAVAATVSTAVRAGGTR